MKVNGKTVRISYFCLFRLAFPGNIGLDKALLPAEAPPTPERLKADKEELENQAKFWKSLLGTHTNHQRQIDVRNFSCWIRHMRFKIQNLNNSLFCNQ